MKNKTAVDEPSTNPYEVMDGPSLAWGWFVPDEIRLEGSRLLWNFEPGKIHSVNPNRRTLREKVLMSFSRLADVPDLEILEYARRWGPLGICKAHQLPIGHQVTRVPSNLFIELACKPPMRGQWYFDRLDDWRDYARQVTAILRLARECHKREPAPIDESQPRHSTAEKPGSKEDWETAVRLWRMYYPNVRGYPQWKHVSVEPVRAGREMLRRIINIWLRANDIRPAFDWDEDGSAIALASQTANNTLLPKLAVQMMLQVNNSIDLALCSGCSRPFFLGRGQSLLRRGYCPECRKKKIPQRESLKRYHFRERKNPRRKKRVSLTEKQVTAIRRALQKPKHGLVNQLAKKYGVSKWTIYKMKERKNWTRN